MDELRDAVKAAVRYRRTRLEDLAVAMELSTSQLDRKLRKADWRKWDRRGFIQGIADALGVTYESIDPGEQIIPTPEGPKLYPSYQPPEQADPQGGEDQDHDEDDLPETQPPT